MFDEKRITYLKTPERSHEEDLVARSETGEVNKEQLAQAKEYVEAAAEIAVGVETGQWS